jgi:microcystin-dependent protein
MTLFNFVPSGTILPFGGATAPAGWLLCDGSAVSRTVYANLYSAIGSVWGSGDGSSTFHLPDLRGRFIRGRDGGVARDPDRTTRTAANSGGNTGDNVGSVQDNATAKNGLTNSTSTTPSSGNRNQFDRTSGNVSADHAHYTTTGGVSANHYHGTGTVGTHTHDMYMGGGNSGTSFMTTRWIASTEWNAGWRSGSDRIGGAGDHGHGNTGWISSDHTHGGWSGGINTNHTHTTTYDSTFSVSGTTPAQTITGDNETRPKNANVNYIIKI